MRPIGSESTVRACLKAGLCGALLALSVGGGAWARGVTIDRRPLHLHVPPGYDGSQPAPLVILLHGIGVSSTLQETYMRVKAEADARGFIYVYPDGTRGGPEGQFWNGAACCQSPTTPPVDDVGYLDHIIEYVRTHYRLDERRIFLIGHSNGGFMASRYACERSQVAAIATLSGGLYVDALRCGPPGRGTVASLHIHATADEITPYFFSDVPGLPSGLTTVFNWTVRNGCLPFPVPRPSFDMVSDLRGNETGPLRFLCFGAPFELWTIAGGSHVPNFYQPGEPGRTFAAITLDWLFTHGRR